MSFLNLGFGEILLILVIALIVFGPGNLVKTARDLGAFVRKVTRSPFWQEVWATRRDLNELPRMIAKEAQLDETLRDLERETRGMQSSVTASVTDLIQEVDKAKKEAAGTEPKPPLEKPPAGP